MKEYVLRQGINVKMYCKPLCGDCQKVSEVIHKAHVPVPEININNDPEAKAKVELLCQGLGRDPAVPVIVVDIQRKDKINSQIVFVEPRGISMLAFGAILRFFRQPVKKH